MEICLGLGDKTAESSRARIGRQNDVGNVVVGGCYILSDCEVDEAFFSGQVEEASLLEVLLLTGDHTPISAGRATQQCTNNPGGLRSILMTTS